MPLTTPPIGVYQNQPTNINFLNTHRFRVVIQRTPNLVYWVQECNLPAMSMGNAVQPTPFVDIPRPGDKIRYEDFTMTFPVDEDMKNFREIGDWMIGLGFPQEFGQYADLKNSFAGVYSDIFLLILDSDHNVQHTVRFIGAFPVSLSQIEFNTTVTDNVIPLVTATFKYEYWQMDDVNVGSTTVTAGDTVVVTQ